MSPAVILTRRLPMFLALTLMLVSALNLGHSMADNEPAPTCSNLQISLSDDKNYVFTATAQGNVSQITSYTFNFGDHQSYHVGFSNKTTQDHHTAAITHAYQQAGAYTATAYFTNADGKHSAIGNCRASVTVGAMADTLPNTGAGSVAMVFGSTAILVAVLHQVWLRRRRTYSRMI